MSVALTRRALLAGGGCLCCAGLAGLAEARILPREMVPLVGPGYKPQDRDEKGLWQQCERIEQEIAGSNLLIRDPRLTRYLSDLTGRIGGPAAKDLRVYLAQVPEFNAFMMPTGFMVVFSGLLTRMRNEAQLAGVLAHESGHFLRKHQLRSWRDIKKKTDLLTVLAIGAGVGGAATGVYAGDLVRLAEVGTIFSLARYSRVMEAEADAMGLNLINQAGYSPLEMSNTWAQMIGEIEASAAMRHKRPHRGYSLLASHPAPADRMADLRISASEVQDPSRHYDTGRERYLAMIAPHRAKLLDDQVKLNDPGASLYIIRNLAADGWNGLLRFEEGEVWRLRGQPGDDQRSAAGYAAAIQFPDAPPEAWRQHGYSLVKAGMRDEGKAALQKYLALAPEAPDAPMVRYSLSQ
jgi:hypothetical protein